MKPLNILVIEDNPHHQEVARLTLKEHNLTLASSFDEGMDYLVGGSVDNGWLYPKRNENQFYLLRSHVDFDDDNAVRAAHVEEDAFFDSAVEKYVTKYDVVLTDLMYSQGRGERLSQNERIKFSQEQLPFGFPVALIAARMGVPYIGIVTDTHHHQHPMAYVMDFFKLGYKKGELSKLRILAQMQLGSSTFMAFDVRDLEPTIYVLKEGGYIPHHRDEDWSAEEWDKIEGGFENRGQTIKNWSAALEQLLKKI